MNDCSLKSINDLFCHEAIRSGKCPGYLKGECVNTEAISTLATKQYLRTKNDFPVRIYFYPYTFGEEMQKVEREIKITLTNIALFMKGVKRKNSRKARL